MLSGNRFMFRRGGMILACVVWVVGAGWYIQPVEGKKMKVGWIEQVRVFPGNVLLDAKIDTGADNSSIHATGIIPFMKEGHEWVRFSVVPKEGKSEIVERPIYRRTKISRHGVPDEERLVVKMGICLGLVYKEDIEVNLADRSNFAYKMLIGRSFLRGDAIVDPQKEFLQEPKCFPE